MSDVPAGEGPGVEARLGVRFGRRALLERALTHRSRKAEDGDAESNEVLEFLGDAVLGLVVAEELVRSMPEAGEGVLTRERAALVSQRPLAALGRAWGLGSEIRMSRSEAATGGGKKASVLADTVEALTGAYYLERGYDACRRFIVEQVLPALRTAAAGLPVVDAKTVLQERLQAEFHDTPSYAVVEVEGPEHDRTFQVEVSFGGEVLGAGMGKTRKSAEQLAAAEALARWKEGVGQEAQ